MLCENPCILTVPGTELALKHLVNALSYTCLNGKQGTALFLLHHSVWQIPGKQVKISPSAQTGKQLEVLNKCHLDTFFKAFVHFFCTIFILMIVGVNGCSPSWAKKGLERQGMSYK